MLKVDTQRFGRIEVAPDQIIRMPEGMLGFAEHRRFLILPHKPDSPFCWFQSLDDPALAFVIVDPFLFKPDYDIDIENAVDQMGWDAESAVREIRVYVVVNVPKSKPEEMTANLIGPILVHSKKKEAIQMVAADAMYSHKHRLIKTPQEPLQE